MRVAKMRYTKKELREMMIVVNLIMYVVVCQLLRLLLLRTGGIRWCQSVRAVFFQHFFYGGGFKIFLMQIDFMMVKRVYRQSKGT